MAKPRPSQKRKELLDTFLFEDGPDEFIAQQVAERTGYSVDHVHRLLARSSLSRPENLRARRGSDGGYFWGRVVEISMDLPGPLESGQNPEEMFIKETDLMAWIEQLKGD